MAVGGLHRCSWPPVSLVLGLSGGEQSVGSDRSHAPLGSPDARSRRSRSGYPVTSVRTATKSSTSTRGCATVTTPTRLPTSRPRTRTPTRGSRRSPRCRSSSSRRSRGRVLETDLSVPARRGPWWYVTRTEEGKQYPIFCRRPERDTDDGEQVLIDSNELAPGHDYFELGALDVSPSHRLLAYSTDVTGAEVFTIRIRDLDTGDRPPRPDRGHPVRHRVVGRRSSPLLHTARRCVAVVPDLAPRARHRRHRRRARLPGGRHPLRRRRRQHAQRSVHRHPQSRAERRARCGCSTRPSRSRTRGSSSRAARPRVQRRPPGRPAADRDEPRRGRLPTRRGADRRPGHGLVARRAPPPARHAAVRHRRVRRPRRRVRMGRRAAHAAGDPRRRHAVRDRSARGGVLAVGRHEPRVRPRSRTGSTTSRSSRRRRCSTSTCVTGERTLLKQQPVLGGFDAGRVRERPHVGHGERRHQGADLARREEGPGPRRQQPCGALRLRLVRVAHRAVVLVAAHQPARPRHGLRRRTRARRRRARPALVPRRQAAAQAQHVHRLRRRAPST